MIPRTSIGISTIFNSKRSSLYKTCAAFSSQSVDTVEFQQLLKTVKSFVRREIIPRARHYDESGDFPWEIIKKAHSIGVMNTEISPQLGGPGLSLECKSRIFEELAYGDSSVGTTLMISELAQTPLRLAGSDYLKCRYLRPMTGAPLLASYAVTESDAGSDVAAGRTSAELNGNHYILNGTKAWITNAGVASWFFVLARTNPERICPPGRAFTGFVVERAYNGILVGEKEPNMGQRCADTRHLTLTDVRVPRANVVGELGGGFGLAMRAFDRVRPVIASMACGLTHRALDESAAYALHRETFGKALIDHQGISFKLANMAMKLEAARELTRKSARLSGQANENATYFASCAKVFASEIAFKAATEAVQIYGGKGFSARFPVEKLLRDSRILQIYGGANEIQRLVISRKLASKYKK